MCTQKRTEIIYHRETALVVVVGKVDLFGREKSNQRTFNNTII